MNKLIALIAVISSLSLHAAEQQQTQKFKSNATPKVSMHFDKTASKAATLKPFNDRDLLLKFGDLNESAQRRADEIKMDKLKNDRQILSLNFSF